MPNQSVRAAEIGLPALKAMSLAELELIIDAFKASADMLSNYCNQPRCTNATEIMITDISETLYSAVELARDAALDKLSLSKLEQNIRSRIMISFAAHREDWSEVCKIIGDLIGGGSYGR